MIHNETMNTSSTVPGQMVISVLRTNRVLKLILFRAPMLREEASVNSCGAGGTKHSGVGRSGGGTGWGRTREVAERRSKKFTINIYSFNSNCEKNVKCVVRY